MDSSRALPSGVVTFLLTDIEGSTRLWEAQPDAMRDALARHDSIVATCVRRLNGHVVKSRGEGDSVFAVFRLARDAVTAALVLQCALGAESWATGTPIRVRMAIHTGQVELRDRDYYGPTVNRCARLRALATGGQVLLSGATARATQDQLPQGASLKDLGSHQLKDLSTPERVWQLAHPRMSGSSETGMAQPASAPAHSASEQRAFVLTDHVNRDALGRDWGERVTHSVSGLAVEAIDEGIRCYASPMLAALMNTLEGGFRLPRLWEALVEPEPTPGDGVLECLDVTTVRQVALPTLTGLHHARFAVLCARAAYAGGTFEAEFSDWAGGWLAGEDSSGTLARELAVTLEREARPNRASTLALPHLLMLANAARAAGHASKLSFLAGRARDEENAQAVACAAEAVRTTLRMAHLDLLALADEVMPKAPSRVAPIRPVTRAAPDRILRALPT